ncbi:trypsin-like peptidase domain-containing protein [Streptomyces mangrovisoli]|uniref:vWA-MoxR associated protein C-terminal domain-containing protein n=1 Tax=Streptomyces mangrovisoli TaxID=1428628 RepID=A0A1J4NN82_9ACTN|nr:trypsin-like peptidase domain-containing protein [Streptomyces mangrovisoli]OIJ63594.1 hypothetical protein WN71_032740 [Streptomyces mangrovisoli]
MPEPASTGAGRARRALYGLAQAATVRIMPPDDHGPQGWGSGFCVAPGWVLTCAHVLIRRDADGVRRWMGDRVRIGFQGGKRWSGRAVYALPGPKAVERWAAQADALAANEQALYPDLALVRLDGGFPEHDCVWLTDRSDPPLGPVGDETTAFGWWFDLISGQWEEWYGHCGIAGRNGRNIFRLGSGSSVPYGVSGGPVLDAVRGEVVGVVKAKRRGLDGGIAVQLSALRALDGAAPLYGSGLGPRPYAALLRAHDRWHHARQDPRDSGGGEVRETWADVQAELGSSVFGWTPVSRLKALELLSALPPPDGPDAVEGRVALALGGPALLRLPETEPLLTWRDGHGQLYDPAGLAEKRVFLHYLLLAAGDHADAAARAAREWAWAEARQLPATERVQLARSMPEQIPTLLLEIEETPFSYGESPAFHWWLRLVRDGGDAPVLLDKDESGDGVPAGRLADVLKVPLYRAFEAHRAARRLEVALPPEYFGTPVHNWRLSGDQSAPIGALREVVLRDVLRRGMRQDDEPEPDDAQRQKSASDWHLRWAASNGSPLRPLYIPEPGRPGRPGRSAHALAGQIPVLCHPAGHPEGRLMLQDVLTSGHGIALWRIGEHQDRACGEECVRFRGAAARLMERTPAGRLPARLLRWRAEAYWRGDPEAMALLALLHDDPTRPLPAHQEGPVESPGVDAP